MISSPDVVNRSYDAVDADAPNMLLPKHNDEFGLKIPTTIPFEYTSPIFKVCPVTTVEHGISFGMQLE
jgi:hypothetical protein